MSDEPIIPTRRRRAEPSEAAPPPVASPPPAEPVALPAPPVVSPGAVDALTARAAALSGISVEAARQRILAKLDRCAIAVSNIIG